jgi:integrase
LKGKEMKKSAPEKTVDHRVKNFLTENEMRQFLEAARKGRNGTRDYCFALLTYRHGFRVSEIIDLRMEELDLKTSRVQVRRLKGSVSTEQPLAGDELRALRAYLRIRERSKFADSPFVFLGERGPMTRQAVNYLFAEIGRRAKLVFKVRPHMLRHSCGYYLANKGYDTRLIQDYLGHQNIQHTVRYTRTAARRFEGLWRK